MAERAGFEPAVPFGITGFQDQLHKPLGHLSFCVEKNAFTAMIAIIARLFLLRQLCFFRPPNNKPAAICQKHFQAALRAVLAAQNRRTTRFAAKKALPFCPPIIIRQKGCGFKEEFHLLTFCKIIETLHHLWYK